MFILITAAALVAILAIMDLRQSNARIARKQEIKRQARMAVRREMMPPPRRAARWAKEWSRPC